MPRAGKNLSKRNDGKRVGRYIKAYSESGKAVYGYVYARTYKGGERQIRTGAWRWKQSASDQGLAFLRVFEDYVKRFL